MNDFGGQHPAPQRTILHLSDTHFVSEGGLLRGRLAVEDSLRGVFESLRGSGIHPDAVVLTGDLSDDGTENSYRRLRDIVDPEAERWGAQTIWVMGNHDRREAFSRVLLGRESSAALDEVHWLDGLRIIALDTSIPGSNEGDITEHQHRWLSEQLHEPAPLGTLIAMHHPPIPTRSMLATLFELRDQRRLAKTLVQHNREIRAILAGHLHYSTFATFVGIPVSVASASCFTQDLTAAYPGLRAVDGNRSFNVVHVYEETVAHSIVPFGTSDPLVVHNIPAHALEPVRAMPRETALAAFGAAIKH